MKIIFQDNINILIPLPSCNYVSQLTPGNRQKSIVFQPRWGSQVCLWLFLLPWPINTDELIFPTQKEYGYWKSSALKTRLFRWKAWTCWAGRPYWIVSPPSKINMIVQALMAKDDPQPRNPREWQSWIILYPHPSWSLSHKLSRIPVMKESGPWRLGFEPLPAGVVLLQRSSIPTTKR